MKEISLVMALGAMIVAALLGLMALIGFPSFSPGGLLFLGLVLVLLAGFLALGGCLEWAVLTSGAAAHIFLSVLGAIVSPNFLGSYVQLGLGIGWFLILFLCVRVRPKPSEPNELLLPRCKGPYM